MNLNVHISKIRSVYLAIGEFNEVCYYIKRRFNKVLTCSIFFFLFFSISSYAQQSVDDEIKNQERAKYIFNLAQQIGWPQIDKQEFITIGVVGADPAFLSLRNLSQTSRIHNLPVKVKPIYNVSDLTKYDLVYSSRTFGYDVKEMLATIKGKNILLITENYEFNSSMINIIWTKETYRYEVNRKLIRKARLRAAASLESYAISSYGEWENLYRAEQQRLQEIAEENLHQKELIELQREQLVSSEETILEKDSSIKNLEVDRARKSRKLREKVRLEKELEVSIEEQLVQLEQQEERIDASNQQIAEQNRVLQAQTRDIAAKEAILKEKLNVILSQKRTNIILIVMLALLFIASVWIYRSYLKDRRLNNKLNSQHKAIKKQQSLLKAKNKELEQFAYIASHDLQEPLNTISSFIDLINYEYGESFDEDGRESLGFIKEASVRMKKLIDALLQYSRLGRGSEMVVVKPNTLLVELQNDLKTMIETAKAKITIDALPAVTANEVELRLLFQNLISNGIKFSKANTLPEISISGKKIHLEDEPNKEFVQFKIEDNGIGIPKKHQNRIFGIFQRLHSRDEFKGAGIGLAHCKKIVESHGGKIWLESTVDEGTTFYFAIPNKSSSTAA